MEEDRDMPLHTFGRRISPSIEKHEPLLTISFPSNNIHINPP